MAAISAARTNPAARIIALDGATRLGAKILVAGGGRCNVTHYEVDERQYAGSSPTAIKRVLRRFDVPQTIAFFESHGVTLKREETGKLFPTTDDAHTVLNALLQAARIGNVHVRHPWRAGAITRENGCFQICPHQAPEAVGESPKDVPHAAIAARRVILATGGKSLPRTGSDGQGYTLATAFGHTITPRTTPALVPLTLPRDHPLCSLSGLTLQATLEVRSGTSKKIKAFTNSTLFTHFGLSGPAVLDISRCYTHAKADDPQTRLTLNVLPGIAPDALETLLIDARTSRITIARFLTELPSPLAERLARVLCMLAGLDPATPTPTLTREQRRSLVDAATQYTLPITGDRGYIYAEVTAGGVPLSELHLDTMESRACPGLHLCGEICDVDGRIGGFNFQWAWASGYVAGVAAAKPAAGLDAAAPT